jgi:threonine dehydrogenase-like Zn-dependent dehydrogenase
MRAGALILSLLLHGCPKHGLNCLALDMLTRKAKIVSPRKFQIFEENLPELVENQVLLKVLSCGICSSELPVYLGDVIGTPGVSFRYKDYPADFGHEVVGEVLEIGLAVKNINVGSIVTGLTYSGCGFSTYFIEDADVLIEIPETGAEESIYALGEPLMATVNILNQMSVEFGANVVIIGDGFMSLLLIAALGRYPLGSLIVVGHHNDRLKLAEKYGASRCINGKEENSWQTIMDITQGKGVDISVEYAGTSSSLQLAASVCKPKQRAQLVLAAAYDNKLPFSIGNYLQNRAPVIIPAYPNHSSNKVEDLKRGIDGYVNGIFPMKELITHSYGLEQVPGALEDCINRADGYIKGIVLPHQRNEK